MIKITIKIDPPKSGSINHLKRALYYTRPLTKKELKSLNK